MNKKIHGTDIHIGDIVQLKAASAALEEKIPHMVALEVVKEKIEGIPRFKYHCIWFVRRKVWEFKYTWLTSTTLELKSEENKETASQKFEIGNIVCLSSIYYEIEVNEEIETPTQFCSPALTIIGFETPKNQAPIFDSNSNVIREAPNLLAKCLYFNPISNKYPEILLPIDALVPF